MGYFKQGNKMFIWGRVTRDASFNQTSKGRSVSGFGVKYDYRYDPDGQPLNEFMEVSCWGKLAEWVGAENTGIGKGDIVLVAGVLMKDTYYKQNEDRSKVKYKLNADLVLDATSIFQLLEMVMQLINGEIPEKESKKKSAISAPEQQEFEDAGDTDDPYAESPFITPEEEEEYDLPY